MAHDLPQSSRRVSNRPFKSAGEDRIEIAGDAQMTDTTMIWHATGERTNGACQIAEIVWRTADVSLHHIHSLEDEGFFVIEGSVTIHTSDGDLELGPGEFGWGPRGLRHGYTVGPSGARVLMVQTPGTQLHEFFKLSTAANPEGLTTDIAAFEGFNDWTQDQYGLKFLDPVKFPPGPLPVGTPEQ